MKKTLCLLSCFMAFEIQTGDNRTSTTSSIYHDAPVPSSLVTATLHETPAKKRSKLRSLFSCFRQKKPNHIGKLKRTSQQAATLVNEQENEATPSTTPLTPCDDTLEKKEFQIAEINNLELALATFEQDAANTTQQVTISILRTNSLVDLQKNTTPVITPGVNPSLCLACYLQ